MSENNLITIFTSLSREFLKVLDKPGCVEKKHENHTHLKTLCQKAYDIIHQSRSEENSACLSEGNFEWYPEILISDYGYQLIQQGHDGAGAQLLENLAIVEQNDYKNLDGIWHLLLDLKGPFLEENFIQEHPFSLSGSDHFFRPTNPYDLLPRELLGSAGSSAHPPPVPQEEPDLFLDFFVEKRKMNTTPTKHLTLHDFIDPGPLRKTVQTNNTSKKALKEEETSRTAQIKSSWSDIERAILDGTEFSDHLDAELTSVKFVEDYERKLKNIGKTPLRLVCQPVTTSKSSKKQLVLGLYEQEAVLKQLMDPSYKPVVPHEVALEYYVSQVKYLLCGVDGDIFQYDNTENKFFMKVGTYVDGISPITLFEFSRVFMETGTFLRNLSSTVKEGLRSDSGVLNPAFWKSVEDYLQRHCDSVAAVQQCSSLMALKLSTTDLHSAMAAVHRLCFGSKGSVPSGGLLLTYLFDYCYAIQQRHVRNVIFSFLFDCSLVYVSKLVEQWVFQGCLDRQWAADLFVRMNPDLSLRRDRSCYLSITVDEAHVPSFLQGLASKIFACGKAVWLLKLFDPENKFIYFLEAMKNPNMRLCTSEKEFLDLEHEFLSYENAISDLCGSTVSFVTVGEMEQEKADEHEAKMKLRQRNAIAKMEERQACELEIRRRKLEEQDRLFKEQTEEIAAKKVKKNDEKIKAQRLAIEIAKKESEELRMIEEKKKQILEQYRTLEETAKDTKRHAEWRSKRFEIHDRRVEFLKQDLLNENTLLDVEGNVISTELDVENANITIGPRLDNQGEVVPTFNDTVTIEQAAGAEKLKHKNLTSQITLASSTIDELKIVKPPLTDAMKNKANVLGSFSLEGEILCTPDENATEAFTNTDAPDPRLNDAMKNKMKVLGSSDQKEEKLAQPPPKPMTDAVRNKIKMHSSEREVEHVENQTYASPKVISDAVRNKMKILGTEIGVESLERAEDNVSRHVVTEAMRNKIMGTEYDILVDPLEERPSPVATDAIKNKRRMMGSSYNNTEAAVVTTKKEMTEAQRNKLKVLGTEYNLPPKHVVCEDQGVLSDLQMNRIRMHRTDPLEASVTPEKPKTPKRQSGEISENITSQECGQETSLLNFSESLKLEQEEMLELESITERPKTLISFKPLSRTSSYPSQLFPSVPHIRDSETKPTFDDLDTGMFARYLQRSINIVVTVQERLANAAVLKHFLLKENFMTHLNSLRCYFLLHDGEFSRSLTNGLFQLLATTSEPHQFFDRSSLSGILNEALIYTSHGSNSNAQNLSFEIWKMPRQLNPEAHDVLTPFQLSYKVRWPVNIIITEASLEKYRKVFHILINLKRVHWTLNETFLLLKTQTKDNTLDGKRLMNSPEYTKLATYRHAMTLFIMTLEEHVCANGPQEAWVTLWKQLETVSNLDHLYQKHVAFVKEVCRRCFLAKASQDLLSYINELIELGLRFHYILKSSAWRLINDKHYGHPQYGSLKSIFYRFCKTTKTFNKTLRKKTHHLEMKIHIPLLELIDLKIKV